MAPNSTFVREMTYNYPELWEVIQQTEGLIVGTSSHAGGVIFVDEPFTETTARMKVSSGDIVTQFDLGRAEKASLIKIDLLSIEALDKIHACLDLLCEQGFIESEATLKETYEKAIGVYNLERGAPEMWEMLNEHQINSIFQLEKQSGVQGIELTKPVSVEDLATLNSIIRLTAPEKGAEQPLDKFARFRRNPNDWIAEMNEWNLTEDEQNIIRKHLTISNGICECQESMMSLLLEPEIAGWSLKQVDAVRKAVAKKSSKDYDRLKNEYYQNAKEKKLSTNLTTYVWEVLVNTQKSYAFNLSHTLAYSIVGLQEMNLAYKYPIIFWNCACLIADSGGAELEENDEDEDSYYNDIEWEDFEELDDSDEEDEDDEDDEEVLVKEKDKKKKKKAKTSDYGKIATAIGKMKAEGVIVAPPDINKSTYTFSPDLKLNIIRYGLSGIVRLGKDKIAEIIANRPYASVDDFLSKVKVNRTIMINLIKSGAFDSFGNRQIIMKDYIASVSKLKKRITLQNMGALISYKILPKELDFERQVYNFNKYLKKLKDGDIFYLDSVAFPFYEAHFDIDFLNNDNGVFYIDCKIWKKIYDSYMDNVRKYIISNQEEVLNKLNTALFMENWNKYCDGSISKWEMDSVSFYSHDHELSKMNYNTYGVSNYFKMSEEPEIDYIFSTKDGKEVPMYHIERIAGTILDKNKDKGLLTLLTREGVVTVKIYKQVFTHYDRQISEKGPDGKKHIIEKSWLSRGNKIIVTGLRRGQNFVAKKYKNTPYHLVELITSIDENGKLTTKQERVEV